MATKSLQAIVFDMVSEFGIGKTYVTIQSLYDADLLDFDTASRMLDLLKVEHCSVKASAKIVLL